jgi:[ribosomal protein S18]-alanine N-acetyltransferase
MVLTTGGAGIALRDYRPSDLEAMFRLDEICFTEEFRFDRESMLAFAEASNAISIVAEDSTGELVGFVIVHLERGPMGRRGYVITLDVAENRRRQGLAAHLMHEAEARVASAGVEWMELHVYTGNESAIRFYERQGYVRVGTRRRFYGAPGLDAFLYRRHASNL